MKKKKTSIKPNLLLETIKIENGRICNLEYHNRRFNRSRRDKFGIETSLDLGTAIHIPSDLVDGVFRCRVLYKRDIEKIEFVPHIPFAAGSLKLVFRDDIDYSVKYADRELLMRLFEKRGDCDEILIVKNGFITDTSISNIAFRKGQGSWVTPDTPLLNGTMRMHLMETGQITEAPVYLEDLNKFSGAKMINCMMDLENTAMIEMVNIRR